jgi:YEATS domain-containing protein 4
MVAIEEPPFEVTETGWGEFEIQIKVHFIPEASEKPMTLFHFLHLHPYGPNKDEEKEKGLTVDAFQYEEIVHSPVQRSVVPFDLFQGVWMLMVGFWRSDGFVL